VVAIVERDSNCLLIEAALESQNHSENEDAADADIDAPDIAIAALFNM
jgi:hypothetical protein